MPSSGKDGANILFVGEAPGENEERLKEPFVGPAGDMLNQVLGRSGLSRTDVKFTNLCHYRPNGNKFELLEGTVELSAGIDELRSYILKHRPNVICALGGNPLYHLTGVSRKITNWRGSILPYIHDSSIKVIPTFHPSFVLRERVNYPTFDLDIKRVASDGEFSEFQIPQREFIIDPKGMDAEEWVGRLCASPRIAVDIECTKDKLFILCVGFAPSPELGVCFVNHGDGQFISCVSRILESNARKTFHFGTFDTEVLHLNGFPETNNYDWDTLTGQHILAPELPRGLDYLTSVYTREPYYKKAGRGEIPSDQKSWGAKIDKSELWIYNCKDCCVTAEIQREQEDELTGRDREMFDYEISLIPVASMMSRNGLLVDLERRELFRRALLTRWAKLQMLLDMVAGEKVNVRSIKLKDLLYTKLKLPVRRNRTSGITTDEDAIVSLITYCVDYVSKLSRPESIAEWNTKLAILKTILEIRGIRVLLSNFILSRISNDNRVRSSYKYSNTDTGRGAAESYVDGTGINSQTFPRSSVEVPKEFLEVDDEVSAEVDDSSPEE